MDILSIGNSFSQDAQRYLHQIARVDGVNIRSFNLCIGGCCLSNHYRNVLNDIVKAYQKAAEHINAVCIIPSGELFGAMLENGIERIHRDAFHASLGLGRYALGLLWYRLLTGNDVTENTFNDFDEEVSAQQIAIAKKCVLEVTNRYKV